LRYLQRLVGEHEAEDLTQDVFVKVSAAMDTFRGESQLSTWIYRIATNTALDRLRSPSYHRSITKGSADDPFARVEVHIENINTWTGEKPLSIDASLIQTEMNDCIGNFIERLPEDYRAVIVLSELEGLKNAQIADILGVTLDVVKIRLHRARKKLKSEMETHCSFYHDERNELGCDLKTAFDKSPEDLQ
ncbi:MAG TPA: RNA polymerase sigma factor, partial [Bacteroidota bacterium]|nr:RNA polymerase sigma factor [Bacteroidota bacterium]